jgi:hypothetical protein
MWILYCEDFVDSRNLGLAIFSVSVSLRALET